ncbi:MAG: hypothetical protein K2W96_27850, partial [Gemmataceae bacterium]|nr:hypothetical protein [Gemmataceae bacterium]
MRTLALAAAALLSAGVPCAPLMAAAPPPPDALYLETKIKRLEAELADARRAQRAWHGFGAGAGGAARTAARR